MKRKNGVLSIFLIFLFAMLLPLSVSVIPASNGPVMVEIETTAIQATQYPTNVVINEVLFDDTIANDKGEFTELYNPTTNAINMSLWTISDEEAPGVGSEGEYEFPIGTIIPSRGFIIVFNDIDPAQLITPDDVANDSLVQLFETKSSAGEADEDNRVANLTRVSGTAEFRLANSGDEIYLRNKDGTIVDSMSYAPSGPEITNVAIENRLITEGDWEEKSLERAWNSYGWLRDGFGKGVKNTPTPGEIGTGTPPEYGGEDPFGGGIPDNIVINEIFFGPLVTDWDAGNGVNWQMNQFIELFNPTDRNINMTGWTLEHEDLVKWMFVEGKHADELGDSDILLCWPDRNDEDANSTWMDPDDNYSPWWQFWNNVDKMEFWYSGDDFNWWDDLKSGGVPPYDQQYEIQAQSAPGGEFELDATGDFVILRNLTGDVIDVVAWGSHGALPGDAAAVIGTQDVGTNHGIGADESLERVWRNTIPVADFQVGIGVYHLPTPGDVVGSVPDEIQFQTGTWETAAGATSIGGSAYGIQVTGTTDPGNDSRIQIDKWQYNPKDHLESGTNLSYTGYVFYRLLCNVSIIPVTISVWYDPSASFNASTFGLYVWNHLTESWDEITTVLDIANGKVIGVTALDHAVSDTMWIGLFGVSTGWDIPGFELAFLLMGLLCLVIPWMLWKSKKFQI